MDRKEGLGNTREVDGHILHNEVGVARDDLLARDNLRLSHGEVEVGVVGAVTRGVHTVTDVDALVGVHLYAATDKPAVTLLSSNTLDLCFARVKVVGDGIHRIGRATVRELGVSLRRLAIHAVGLVTVGKDILRLHVDAHKVGLEVHALIRHIATLVAIYHLVRGIEHNRVNGLTLDDVIEHRGRNTATVLILASCVPYSLCTIDAIAALE